MNDDSRLDCSDIHQEETPKKSAWAECLESDMWQCQDGRKIPFKELHYCHIKNILSKVSGSLSFDAEKKLEKLMRAKLWKYKQKVKKEEEYKKLPGIVKRLKALQIM